MYKKSIFILSVAIISIFFALIGWSVYRYYALLSTDNAQDPMVFVSSGSLTLIRGNIEYGMVSGESLAIQPLDKVISHEDSFSRIVWPDGSLTRIGASTSISIRELSYTKNLSKSQIRIDIEKGKIWTNIVRAFFGDSYFETNMPDEGVVAAVRGTVFEINLESGYIHSVNHSIGLTDKKGRTNNLLPGDIVKVNNIFETLSREILDKSWNLINTYADSEFIKARTEQIKQQIIKLSNESNWWDRFIRKILSYFTYFDRITVAKMIDSGTEGFDSIKSSVSTASLVRWYQDIANMDISTDLKQSLREKILKNANDEEKSNLKPTLLYGALWNRFSASGANLVPAIDAFIKDISGDMTPEIQSLYDHFSSQTQEIGDVIQGNLDTLKGAIQEIAKPNK